MGLKLNKVGSTYKKSIIQALKNLGVYETTDDVLWVDDCAFAYQQFVKYSELLANIDPKDKSPLNQRYESMYFKFANAYESSVTNYLKSNGLYVNKRIGIKPPEEEEEGVFDLISQRVQDLQD